MTTRESFGLDVKEALKGADAYEEIMAAFDDVTLEKGVMPKDTPNTEQTVLRREIVNRLSKVQLYAKDHPYDVTASDEADVEQAADEIVALCQQAAERDELAGRIGSIQLYMDTCEEQGIDPSWPTLHEFQDGQRLALAELQKEKDNK